MALTYPCGPLLRTTLRHAAPVDAVVAILVTARCTGHAAN